MSNELLVSWLFVALWFLGLQNQTQDPDRKGVRWCSTNSPVCSRNSTKYPPGDHAWTGWGPICASFSYSAFCFQLPFPKHDSIGINCSESGPVP